MTQYRNIKNYIKLIFQGEFLSPEEDFKKNNKVSFRCKNNHTTNLTIRVFINKKREEHVILNPEYLCTECYKDCKKELLFDEEKEKILENTGHTLIKIIDREEAYYNCGNCKSENNKCWLSNLHDNKGCCPKCQNKKFKNDIEDVRKRLNVFGVKLVKYIDCHNIDMICYCGSEFNGTLRSVERGRLCGNCKIERAEETCLEKYGVKNPFQAKECKEKMKETCLEKYGVEHHLQNKEILEKLKKTMLETYGIEYAFHSEESFEKSRQTCLDKYGVEYPLQSEEIYNKIKATNLKKYGVEYPFQSEEIHVIIKSTNLEKYGVEYFFQSQEFVEKYPIYMEQARETCLEKYGVEYPMQNVEVFSKAMSSRFNKKEYKFPSGRIEYIMGYEPGCVDELLKTYPEDQIILKIEDIPVFDYIKQKKNVNNELYDDSGRYYPDILLPDKIIEVKSTYTYKMDQTNNDRKMKACVDKGYNIELWIYETQDKLYEKRLYKKDGTIEIIKKLE